MLNTDIVLMLLNKLQLDTELTLEGGRVKREGDAMLYSRNDIENREAFEGISPMQFQ